MVGFSLGIAYGNLLGHRGLSHSLAFATDAGVLGMFALRRGALPDARRTSLAGALILELVRRSGPR